MFDAPNFNTLIQTIAVYAIPVLFAITLHESAHAYVARYFGDTTAAALGRVSLDPFRHLDVYGTILIPLALYILTSGTFLFGYAKPVPVNFANLRQPKKQMAWVALAGPAANFFMAAGWMMASLFLSRFSVDTSFFLLMAKAGVLVNLVLFAFNLFPLLPLDGGRILMCYLPSSYAIYYEKLEPYGFLIVLILVFTKLMMTVWLLPVMLLAQTVLGWVLFPFRILFSL